MSHNVANLSGAPVLLTSGTSMLCLPVGYNGPVTLSGSVTVSTLGDSVVSTNVVPGTGTGFCLFTCSVNAPQTASWTGGGSALPVGSTAVVQVLAESGAGLFADNFTVPDAYAVHYAFTVATLEPLALGWTVTTNAWPSVTNYFTNFAAGSEIGSYTADTTLRSVQVSASAIETTDFGASVEAFSLGFIFALTVSVYKWVARIFRTLPGNSSEF